MSRLTVRLPATLHQQLARMAEDEGVSLNQYVVYALTRQMSASYTVRALSEDDVARQKQRLTSQIEQLDKAPSADIERALAARDVVEPESELTPDLIARLQGRIQDASGS